MKQMYDYLTKKGVEIEKPGYWVLSSKLDDETFMDLIVESHFNKRFNEDGTNIKELFFSVAHSLDKGKCDPIIYFSSIYGVEKPLLYRNDFTTLEYLEVKTTLAEKQLRLFVDQWITNLKWQKFEINQEKTDKYVCLYDDIDFLADLEVSG